MKEKNKLYVLYFALTFAVIISTIACQEAPIIYGLGQAGPAGGYIFYNKGTYSDGWQYLEAAPLSTEWTLKQWGGMDTLLGPSTQDIIVGSGQTNTTNIVDVLGTGDYAAKSTADLIYGGYDDWFLPSLQELDLMHTNLSKQYIGGFSWGLYWSSSESDADSAWVVTFGTGDMYDFVSKNQDIKVRAIRAF